MTNLTGASGLTPFRVARSQLLTAIDLFFNGGDPVSIYSLAGAAAELLEELCRSNGIEPMTDILLRDHPGKNQGYVWNARNLCRNAFKHLGRTVEERARNQAALDQYDERVNEFLLYVCVEDYVRLRGAMPIPFQVMQAWFAVLHLDLLAAGRDPAPFRALFPGIDTMTRAEQKQLGKEAIARWSKNDDLQRDPKTEPVTM